MKYSTLVTALLIFFSRNAFGQSIFTLQQCVDSALINNLTIKEQGYTIQYLENNYQQTKYDLLPDLRASSRLSEYFGQTFNFERTRFIDERITSFSVGISSNVALFEGFRKYHLINRSKLDLASGKERLELLKNQITLEVVNSYLTILYNQEQSKILVGQIEITSQQIERAKKMVDAGKIPFGELYSLFSQKAEEEAQWNRYQSQVQMAKILLSQQMNIRNTEFDIVVPDLDSLTVDFELNSSIEQFVSEALQFLPEMRLAENSLLSAKYDLAIAKSALYPSLYLSSGLSFPYNSKAISPTGGDYPFFDQLKDRKQAEIGLSLSIPVFNRFQNRTNIKNAQLQIITKESALDRTRQDIFKAVQSAYNDVLIAQKNLKSREEALKAAREAYRFAEQRFNAGTISAADYSQEKARLNQASMQLLQAKYDFVVKMKILDFYRGVKIKL